MNLKNALLLIICGAIVAKLTKEGSAIYLVCTMMFGILLATGNKEWTFPLWGVIILGLIVIAQLGKSDLRLVAIGTSILILEGLFFWFMRRRVNE